MFRVFVISLLAVPLQTAQPIPQPPQAKVEPCVIPAPPPALPKGVKPHLPKWLQQQIAKQQQRIEERTGIHVDPNQIAKDATAPKPCPVTPVIQPKPQQ
jgi:hypothetical protein